MRLSTILKFALVGVLFSLLPTVASEFSIEELKPNDSRFKMIKQGCYDMVMAVNSNVFSEDQAAKKAQLDAIWQERQQNLEQHNSQLLLVRQNDTPICSVFLYPGTLSFQTTDKPLDVVVKVGLVPFTKEQTLQSAIDQLTKHVRKTYPKHHFLTYTPKDYNPFVDLLKSQRYREFDLEGCTLNPVNHLNVFPNDKFNWYINHPTD